MKKISEWKPTSAVIYSSSHRLTTKDHANLLMQHAQSYIKPFQLLFIQF